MISGSMRGSALVLPATRPVRRRDQTQNRNINVSVASEGAVLTDGSFQIL
jgi:hypothetical protein